MLAVLCRGCCAVWRHRAAECRAFVFAFVYVPLCAVLVVAQLMVLCALRLMLCAGAVHSPSCRMVIYALVGTSLMFRGIGMKEK